MAHALGIDLGGTKILAGLIDTETGQVLSTAVQPTRAHRGPENVLDRLLAVAEEAISSANIEYSSVQAIGIGAAGQVDSDRGMLVRAPNLPEALVQTPLTQAVRDRFDRPAVLVNDVVAAAAGEASFGAGRSHRDFVCIFVGTGIGGAIYRDGRPHAGATNTAGEIGHIVVDAGGRLCGCGGKGHLEAYASRTAMIRAVLGALKLGRESTLEQCEPDPNPDDPAHSGVGHQELAAAVQAGDQLALEVIEEGARYMAAGLVSLVNFYNPPRIILGGGVVGEIDVFFERARTLAGESALTVAGRKLEIVKAEMGENPGIIGAAMLAMSHA